MDIKGTKTEENLLKAFQGESCARAKYLYFSEQAQKENRSEVSELFEKMAVNETAHARIWFRYLNGMGKSEENLETAMKGEAMESSDMYPSFAKQAREEGLEELAELFERVAEIEHQHEIRFRKELLRMLGEEMKVAPSKKEELVCICSQCGYQQTAAKGEPPYACPVCGALGTMKNELRMI